MDEKLKEMMEEAIFHNWVEGEDNQPQDIAQAAYEAIQASGTHVVISLEPTDDMVARMYRIVPPEWPDQRIRSFLKAMIAAAKEEQDGKA